jgi:hypothetical protein
MSAPPVRQAHTIRVPAIVKNFRRSAIKISVPGSFQGGSAVAGSYRIDAAPTGIMRTIRATTIAGVPMAFKEDEHFFPNAEKVSPSVSSALDRLPDALESE